ncbi:MAG: hypothetical protein ABR953_05580 [Candidatus Acidiferrales bacterium]
MDALKLNFSPYKEPQPIERHSGGFLMVLAYIVAGIGGLAVMIGGRLTCQSVKGMV